MKAPFDLEWIRAQFPALTQEMNGQRVIFFDGPGGTQVPQVVIDAMGDYLVKSNANFHGAFATSARTDELIDSARSAIADFLGCDRDEVVFGANMTTLTFAFSRVIGRQLQAGDEIIVTRLDHDANVSPWCALAEERGVIIRFVDINVTDCTLDWSDLERQINQRTRLIAVGYASNAVGTINDIAAVVRLASKVGALVFVDAVHYAPHGPIDVKALNCDFLACSAYKFFGPHVGIVYGKRQHLASFKPYKVRPASEQVPFCWESGTQNHEGLAGIVAAIDYLAQIARHLQPVEGACAEQADTGKQQAFRSSAKQSTSFYPNRRAAIVKVMKAIQKYELSLSQQLICGLAEIPGLTLYGITQPERSSWRTPTVAIRLAEHTPFSVAKALGDRGIFTWHGNFYAINLTERLGVETNGGLLRIGLVHYNTQQEIQRFLQALHDIAAMSASSI